MYIINGVVPYNVVFISILYIVHCFIMNIVVIVWAVEPTYVSIEINNAKKNDLDSDYSRRRWQAATNLKQVKQCNEMRKQ